MCAKDPDDGAEPWNLIGSLASGAKYITTLTKVLGVLALAFGAATVFLAWKMGSDDSGDLWWVVLIAFALSLGAMLVAFSIIARRVASDSPHSVDPPPVSPPSADPVHDSKTLFDLSYFRSPFSRQIASEFSAHCTDDSAGARFFVEMFVHRLNTFGAQRHSHGYTIIRHCTELPEHTEVRIEQIMRDDYAAIMEVGVETTLSQNGKPALDTLIFRDVELWRHSSYWRQNEPLAEKADLRRLFLYEDDFFTPGIDGLLEEDQNIQLVGLFSGTRFHDWKEWKWRQLNVSRPPPRVDIGPLFGPDEEGFEFQSSAAFGGHTVVFICLMRNPWTLVHRFYNRSPTSVLDKVDLYNNSFKDAFEHIRKQTAKDLYLTLRKKENRVESCIDRAWARAVELVPEGTP